MRVIHQKDNFRIIEEADNSYTLEDLKGDSFTFEQEHNSQTRHELKQAEKAFELKVEDEGVFGYSLEKWNPEVDKGWEHVDSCWGFVGQFDENPESEYHHYIVDELKNQIEG